MGESGKCKGIKVGFSLKTTVTVPALVIFRFTTPRASTLVAAARALEWPGARGPSGCTGRPSSAS
jgi:hypothetical protein